MRLVEIAQITRKTVTITIMILSLYLLYLVSKQPARNLYLSVFPPKDLPTLAFGLLEPLEFTAIPILNATPQFVLNTRTGQLPTDLPIIGKVYRFVPTRISFGAGERAQKDASTLGFTDDMRVSQLSSSTFSWEDIQFGGKLDINLNNNTLTLYTPLTGKGSYFPAGKFKSREDIIQQAKNLMTSLGRFKDVLYTKPDRGSQIVTYGKFRAEGVVKADSPIEAQIVRIDFFRKITDFPILGPDPKKGLLRVFMRAEIDKNQFPQLSFPLVEAYYWELDLDETKIATYPLIPVNTAWEQVSQNKGVVANVTQSGVSPFVDNPPVRVDRILINDVYLAYFDSTKPQTHLQPIYVFQGNFNGPNGISGDITIYYPAVSGQYVKAQSNTNN